MSTDALLAAAASGDEVRVWQRIPGTSELNGFVVAVGAQWALLANLDASVLLDGYVAVPVDTVGRVRTRSGAASIARRVLELDGALPIADPPPVDLTTARAVVESVAACAPLLGLAIERERPGALRVGAYLGVTRRNRARLLEIDPRAEWDPRSTSYALRDLTHVSFGDRYLDALWRLGGPPPRTA